VPDLLQKIKTSAAERLTLPEGRSPGSELKRYKNYLKVESARLKMLHRGGTGGMEICRARAAVLDELHTSILESVKRNFQATHKEPLPRYALIAIGGYGRAELNPNSDIDIMLLHTGDNVAAAAGKLPPFLQALTDPGGLLYTLFDINLKVGYSVRTIADCVKVANEDMQSKTSLLEARLITGDEGLFEQFKATLLARCIMGFENRYIEERVEDQKTRRAKWGVTPLLQEPNIKNGCGGLRDFQNLIWMALVKFRTRSLEELQEQDLISRRERMDLSAAYDFLLRTRNELHYLTGKDGDILTKAVQPKVAYALGYTDRSPATRLEKFMRDYYSHSRLLYLICRTVEQRLALSPNPTRLGIIKGIFGKLVSKPSLDGFEMADGEIRHESRRVFSNSPRRLMRVFLYAQQRDYTIHPDTAQLIRQSLRLVDSSFIADPHVHESFAEILAQSGNVAPTLRAMHDLDFLGKYLPEFGRLTCLVQHEFYHQYTGDEHTLRCIEKLDELHSNRNQFAEPYQRIFNNVDDPFPLYLALLLHDAGRGLDDARHEDAGVKLAKRVAKRLKLDIETRETVKFLVQHHLTMVSLSQRRDLDDPAVISHFSSIVESPNRLNLLTLHTVADSLGTANGLWNGFKDQLLRTLYSKTKTEVAGETALLRSQKAQRDHVYREVRAILPQTFQPDEINAHFDKLPPRYFRINGPRDIAADMQLVHRFMWNQLGREDTAALSPIIMWRDEPDLGCTTVRIASWDRLGLFSTIAGAFAAAGLSILSARGFTREDEIVLDTFEVVAADSGKPGTKKQREQFEAVLERALTNEDDFIGQIAEQTTTRGLQDLYGENRIESRIRFDNDTSELFTVIDLETEDRVGLLYTVSKAFAELGIDIDLVKITTEKGAAIDSFYVEEHGGGKLTDPRRQIAVESKLRSSILVLDELCDSIHYFKKLSKR
jgi:[protein-PII] uridylyltransferase